MDNLQSKTEKNPHTGHRERLRKLYADAGKQGLPDHMLLELLLSYAIPRRDVNPLAHDLLTAFGSLNNLFTATPEEWQSIRGVGENTVTLLGVVSDLYHRIQLQGSLPNSKRIRLRNSEQVCRYGLSLSLRDRYETARILCLDATMRVLHVSVLSVGTTDSVLIDPRHVVEKALFYKADSIILMHNHPSGNVTPSKADIDTVERINALAEELRLKVRDHLILGKSHAYSFTFDRVFFFVSPTVTENYSLDEYLTGLVRTSKAENAETKAAINACLFANESQGNNIE